jgi:hypothetical protein
MEDAEFQVNDIESNGFIDETEKDDSVAPVQYNITSFGADYDVEGLVRRLDRGDILIPSFQRDYVWSISEASRFVESLLLGLPVPGVFLARETETNRLIVIDGQQRLKSLQFFSSGYFSPDPQAVRQRVFKLTKVQTRFDGLTYDTLSDDDRRFLDNSIIHATIIKQESPKDDDTSIYHIFERLNNSGRKLTPQQIRVAIYHGNFINLVKSLNSYEPWRAIFGTHSSALKDQELIIRFLALYHRAERYERPMNEFLNKYTLWSRQQNDEFLLGCRNLFTQTIDVVYDAIGPRAFRPERAFNAAVFDSVMVALARIGAVGGLRDSEYLRDKYQRLLSDPSYLQSVSQSTSDEKNVQSRLTTAYNFLS